MKAIQPEDFVIEQKKRNDRRTEIKRPRKSIQFNLDNNKIREFKIADIVQSDERVIRSAERNEPQTPGRLVKLRAHDPENEPAAPVDTEEASQPVTEVINNDAATAATAATNAPASPAAEPAMEQAPQEEENFETQSGDGSNQEEEGECERGSEERFPTLSEINMTENALSAATLSPN